MQGTFRIVFDSVTDSNLQVQVRSSQATKELSTYLLGASKNNNNPKDIDNGTGQS